MLKSCLIPVSHPPKRISPSGIIKRTPAPQSFHVSRLGLRQKSTLLRGSPTEFCNRYAAWKPTRETQGRLTTPLRASSVHHQENTHTLCFSERKDLSSPTLPLQKPFSQFIVLFPHIYSSIQPLTSHNLPISLSRLQRVHVISPRKALFLSRLMLTLPYLYGASRPG